ncbi:hypothetical protein C8035_v011270 [Colletotrichum spinosum]|uniref:Uncharacterized protein n=1 Tax=Colletotrichum spinosum TaxID=1347390 RepID=A0A4R8Q1M1_9PEZI|nr:hypothetical protein C8035_v011270 [Colletotrichum spinosum]
MAESQEKGGGGGGGPGEREARRRSHPVNHLLTYSFFFPLVSPLVPGGWYACVWSPSSFQVSQSSCSAEFGDRHDGADEIDLRTLRHQREWVYAVISYEK